MAVLRGEEIEVVAPPLRTGSAQYCRGGLGLKNRGFASLRNEPSMRVAGYPAARQQRQHGWPPFLWFSNIHTLAVGAPALHGVVAGRIAALFSKSSRHWHELPVTSR
jgi:hypothetical protein